MIFPSEYCTAKGVTRRQMQSVVKKYFEANPAQLHLNASTLVINAFIEAFPCE